MARQETKDAVINEIAKVAHWAIRSGGNPYKVVCEKFPDVPFMVQIDGIVRAELQSDDEWWEQVEKTIDGEIVRNALVGGRQS